MGDFLDIDDTESPPSLSVAVADPGDPIERLRLFDTAWSKLRAPQQAFLKAWKENRFNISRTWVALGKDNRTSMGTEYRWRANEDYAFCKKIIQLEATAQVLERERLVLRQDDCAEQLLEPKPILYQGHPTGYYENQPAAAAKVNETLLKVGGHLKEEDRQANFTGPALVVQVTNRIGGEILSTTTVGVAPQLPAPEYLDDGS
jgi:hypothetical protein